MCIIRHYLAGNLIITQGGQFINTIDTNLGHWTPITVNLVQLVFVALRVFAFSGQVGKRPSLIFSVGALSLVNFAIGFTMM